MDCTVNSLDSDTNESKILTACSDKTVRTYILSPTASPIPHQVLTGHMSSVSKALFIGHGELIISLCMSSTLIIWKLEHSTNTSAGEYVKRHEIDMGQSGSSVVDIAVCCDVTSEGVIEVFCGMGDGRIGMVRIDSNFREDVAYVAGHRYGVVGLAWNGGYLVTAGEDGKIKVWSKIDEKTLKNEEKVVNELKDKNKKESKNKDENQSADDFFNIPLSNEESFIVNTKQTASLKELVTLNEENVIDVAVCPQNCFSVFCFAVCTSDGKVAVYRKAGHSYDRVVVYDGGNCNSVAWSRAGFSLAVGIGSNEFKTFAPNCDGKFVEVEVERIE